MVKIKKINSIILLVFLVIVAGILYQKNNKVSQNKKLLPSFDPATIVKAEVVGTDEKGSIATLTFSRGNEDFWNIDGLAVDSKKWSDALDSLANAEILEEHTDFANFDVEMPVDGKQTITRVLRLTADSGEMQELTFGDIASFGQYVRVNDEIYLINKQLILSINEENWLDRIVADIDAKTIEKIVVLSGKNISDEIVLARDPNKGKEKDIFFMMNDRLDKDTLGKRSGPLPALPYILNRISSDNVLDIRKFDKKLEPLYKLELITKDGFVSNIESFKAKDDTYYWKLKASTNVEANDIAKNMAKYYNELWQNALYQMDSKKQEALIDMPVEKILEIKNAKQK